MTEALKPLVSTVAAASPEAVSSLSTEAKAASDDGSVLQTEVQASISALVKSLATNGAITETSTLKQLAEASPAVAAFIAKLQQTITETKEGSTQGLILAAQLQAGSITQEQFKSQVDAIVLPASQLEAAVGVVLPGESQKLILSVASVDALKKIDEVLSSAAALVPSQQAGQMETAFDEGDQAESLKTLQTLIEAVAAGSASLESVENDFLTQTLAKITAANPALTDTQKAQLTTAIQNFLQQTLAKIGSVATLVSAAQAGKLTAIVSLAAVLQASKLQATKAPGAATTLTPLPVTAVPKPQENTKLQTQFKDENLSFLQNLFKVAAQIAAQNLKASASSLLSLKPAPRIMTGARAVLKINNKVVALCNNVSYEINMDWGEVRGVDELIPNDLAPMVFSVKGSMSIYRVPNKSPIDDFIHPDMFRGMIWPYTTIEIRDKRTDELIMLVKRAAITSRAESFTKNQLTSTNMSFVGIGFRDESTPEFLPDKLTGEDSAGGILGDAFKAISNLLS